MNWILWRGTASKMADRSPRRGELWAADLNPRRGSEPGKVRPVVVIQSDLLNETDHPSTWILPCTTMLAGENILRVELARRMAGNARACEVMIDQSRAIDPAAVAAAAAQAAANGDAGGFRKVTPRRRSLILPDPFCSTIQSFEFGTSRRIAQNSRGCARFAIVHGPGERLWRRE